MKTCIPIAIRFEETLIVQEHSTLKYGTFLGLKKRGNCTQLLEKTFREGKGPNHFSFFFSLASSSPIFLTKTFHPSYRLKTILTNQWFSISSRILVAPSPRIDTSLRPPFPLFHLSLIAVFLQLRANFSLFWNVYYVFILIPDSASGVETPSVCFPSTDRTLSSSLPSENVSSLFLFVPFTQREHSSSLLIPQ